MIKSLYVLTMIFFIATLYAKENVKENVKLVWPTPPDEAKIEYLFSLISSKDMGIKKGFFSKLYDLILGTSDPSLKAPFGLHAKNNRVYVTDISEKALYVFDKDENEMITVNGSDDENFLYPIDVATDSKGNIYVSDSARAKVYVFDEDGDFEYSITSHNILRAVGIAISPDDKKIYIVDPVASKIHVTTLKGKYIKSIGSRGSGNGQFNKPTFIDIAKDGKIYVSDSMNHRIQILDRNGAFIDEFGQLGQNIGDFGSPRGISLDSDENIYVSDTMFNTIQIFNHSGELLMVLGGYGSKKGEFSLCEDISITDNNEIYVSDTNNKRVQVFKLLESTKKRSLK